MRDYKFNKAKSAIRDRIPEFIRVDNPRFVAFLDAYFEWLHSTYSPLSPGDIKLANDVDYSIDLFTDHFYDQFLRDLPQDLAFNPNTGAANKAAIIKNIKDFYRSKGTERSYSLLFRILFDSDASVYLPKTDILRASGGTFVQQTSIRITTNKGDEIFGATNKRIRQINPATGAVVAYARVSRIVQIQVGEYRVAELFINDIQGVFVPDLPIEFTKTDQTKVRESTTYSCLTGLTITRRGFGHSVGERITIGITGSEPGTGAVAEVSRVDSNGGVLDIRIVNFGANYRTPANIIVTFLPSQDERDQALEEAIAEENNLTSPTYRGGWDSLNSKDQNTAVQNKLNDLVPTGAAIVGAVCQYEGYYADNGGHLSSTKVLQDNRYYQDFSYVIRSELAIRQYRDVVKNMLHPAGFGFFGLVEIKKCLEADLQNSVSVIQYETPFIGNYTPYRLSTTQNLASVYPEGYLSPISGITLATPGLPGADPYWIIFAHPNTRSLPNIPSGISFGAIHIKDFIRIPTGYEYNCADADNDGLLEIPTE
jgi:hypothetical protein